MRYAVFASGNGSNLQALIDGSGDGSLFTIALVITDRPNVGALTRASRAGITAHILQDHADGTAIANLLRQHEIDFIVLAGYLRLIPRDVVEAFDARMINIHPALLPSFGGKGMYGARVHEAVIDSGAKVTGPTIHLVTSEYDKGLILAQWPVPVLENDSPETLAARVLEVEHKLLPAVARSIAQEGPGRFQFTFSRFRGDSETVLFDESHNS